MATTTSVPRFLLPQRGLIWRRIPATRTTPSSGAGGSRVLIRFASSSKPSTSSSTTTSTSSTAPKKPLVLEKPERFNPPSHGSRLPKKGGGAPKHYGGGLSEAEFAKQKTTHYPGMMAPEGTFEHKFWHQPWIHTIIALTALTSLALWTFTENFKAKSPYYDMVPAWGDLLRHPISSTRLLFEVLRLNSAYEAAIAQEKRERKINDVAKRLQYRRAHGLPDEMGLFADHPWNKEDQEKEAQRGVKAEDSSASSSEDGGVPAGTAR